MSRRIQNTLIRSLVTGILSKNPGVVMVFVLGLGIGFFSYEVFKPRWLSSEGPARLNVCFTPDENCTDLIIQEIRKARQSIKVQAFPFTSKPLSDALIEAYHRGVDVQLVLDRSNLKDPYSMLGNLRRASIPIFIDVVPGIAHNKIMIIDQEKVLTGSFNFTKAAQTRNAENIMLIQDVSLARHYVTYWEKRQKTSKKATKLSR